MINSIVIGCVLAAAQSANADLITNGSFENLTHFVDNHRDQDTDSLAVGSKALDGWTTFGANLAWIGQKNYYGVTAEDGKYSLDLTGYYHPHVYAGIEQTIETQVGHFYQLSYYLGGDYGTTGITASAGETVRTSRHHFHQFGWAHEFFNFKATSTSTLISLIGKEACSNERYLGLENVSVTQANNVPEPSSFALLGLGGLALCAFRRGSRLRSFLQSRRPRSAPANLANNAGQ